MLNSLKYPLNFIDYEFYHSICPEFDKEKCYNLPFQYFLHIIEKEGDTPIHKEFLAENDDPNFIRHFAESMINDIFSEGSVIIYSQTEFNINKMIAMMYPDLKDNLEQINENIIDFQRFLKTGTIIVNR